jgi:hypothetical protein
MQLAIERLATAADRFEAELDGLPGGRWLETPAGGGWSPNQVTEHVTVANGNICAVFGCRLQPILDAAPAVADDEIPYLFYRGDEPPGVAPPTGTWTDEEKARADFRASVDAIAAAGQSSPVDLRTVGFAHPAFGLLDGMQWILFAGAHLERHRAQIIALGG